MKTGLFLECQKAHGRAVDWLVQLLPAKIKAFIEAESWAGHINPDTGKPFGSFYECAVTRIPHGLGFDGKDRRHTYAQVVSYCDLQRGDVAMMMRQQQPALAGHGEIGNGRSRDYNIMSTPTRQGTDPSYLVSRLKRDAPEIAERLADGEFRSVRAAAIEAGIVKVPTVFERVQKLLPKLTDAEWQQLTEMRHA
jgi:hypothetical protein